MFLVLTHLQMCTSRKVLLYALMFHNANKAIIMIMYYKINVKIFPLINERYTNRYIVSFRSPHH